VDGSLGRFDEGAWRHGSLLLCSQHSRLSAPSLSNNFVASVADAFFKMRLTFGLIQTVDRNSFAPRHVFCRGLSVCKLSPAFSCDLKKFRLQPPPRFSSKSIAARCFWTRICVFRIPSIKSFFALPPAREDKSRFRPLFCFSPQHPPTFCAMQESFSASGSSLGPPSPPHQFPTPLLRTSLKGLWSDT